MCFFYISHFRLNKKIEFVRKYQMYFVQDDYCNMMLFLNKILFIFVKNFKSFKHSIHFYICITSPALGTYLLYIVV